MLLPGPEAMQLATYLGWLMHGVPGGLIAHGEHLTRRCQSWTDDMSRQQDWAPEVA
jgi:hypothetical protein